MKTMERIRLKSPYETYQISDDFTRVRRTEWKKIWAIKTYSGVKWGLVVVLYANWKQKQVSIKKIRKEFIWQDTLPEKESVWQDVFLSSIYKKTMMHYKAWDKVKVSPLWYAKRIYSWRIMTIDKVESARYTMVEDGWANQWNDTDIISLTRQNKAALVPSTEGNVQTESDTKKCVVCWKYFDPKTSRQKMCSTECAKKHHRDNAKVHQLKRYYEVKGMEQPDPSKNNKVCIICWEEFHTNRTQKTTCSKICSKKNKINKAAKYLKKYRNICKNEINSPEETVVKQPQQIIPPTLAKHFDKINDKLNLILSFLWIHNDKV